MRLTYELGHGKTGEYDTINDKDMPANNIWKAINKLGQLEDIEEELGIDLITLLKGTCIWKEIENVAKALDIVFDKIVDLYFIENGCSFEEYNKEHRTGYPLEKEEFELLRKTYLDYLHNSIQNNAVNDDNTNLSSLHTTNEYKNDK